MHNNECNPIVFIHVHFKRGNIAAAALLRINTGIHKYCEIQQDYLNIFASSKHI